MGRTLGDGSPMKIASRGMEFFSAGSRRRRSWSPPARIAPQLLFLLRDADRTVRVGRTSGNSWRDFGSVPNGMRHIMEGTDHFLFLLVPLLPAPLVTLAAACPAERA
jgi:hypothetical protein